MSERFTLVGHFDTLEGADRACEWLEDNEIIATIRQEAAGGAGTQGIFALLVPGDQVEAAQRALRERPASEEVEAMKTLDYFEEQHPDVAERFEESDYSRKMR